MNSASKTTSLQPLTAAPDARPELAEATGTAVATSDKKAPETEDGTQAVARPSGRQVQDLLRNFQSRSRQGHLRFSRNASGAVLPHPVFRRRNLRADPGERSRLRCFHRAAHLRSGVAQPDAAAADHRCAQAGFGAAHHGGDFLFRLCPAGPQGQAARSDSAPSWWPIF